MHAMRPYGRVRTEREHASVRTVVSGVRDHNIRIGRDAIGIRAIRFMNNFHRSVQSRPTASLQNRQNKNKYMNEHDRTAEPLLCAFV